MTRKPKKDAMLIFRATASVHAQIQEASHRDGVSKSTYVRSAIIRGLETGALTKEEKAILRDNPM
jgi:hypothetical protein